MNYTDFLTNKISIQPDRGFDADESILHESLKPHQIDSIRWACMKGSALVACSFGLGKTRINIAVLQQFHVKYNRPVLIVCPLGVKHQFQHEDGPVMGVQIDYIRNHEEQALSQSDFHITNYERVRDSDLDLSMYCCVALDEGSVLRSLGSDTTQQFIRKFKSTPHKFVYTATPAPNEYLELINYSEFIGAMDRGQALTRFFKRDSQKAGNLTIHPIHEESFWLWLSSWALFLTKPSDLGHSDEGYSLPAMNVTWHMVDTDPEKMGVVRDRDGQTKLVADSASSLPEAAKIKRASITERMEMALQIMKEPTEGEEMTFSNGLVRRMKLDALYNYNGQTEKFRLIGYTGYRIHFKTEDNQDHFVTDNVFADMHCMDDNYLLWHLLEDERKAIEKIPNVVTVFGSQDLEKREQSIMDFAHGNIRILATKPEIAGSGCNFQKHCNNAIFMSIDYKFNDFIQAVHRIYRFLQDKVVNIHIIYTREEQAIADALKRKWIQHDELQETMRDIIAKYGLHHNETIQRLTRKFGCERQELRGKHFVAINNDSVDECANLAENSVGLIHTSIPFGNHYEYSASYNDFGHNKDNQTFWNQMDFLIPNLYRALKPGRNAIIHVKDRVRYGTMTGHGMTTLDPFSDECTAAFRKHGFHLMGRITIVTDVVRENNQTYRLGHTEKCKDASKMGCGLPEYLLILRKPQSDTSNGYADEPVVKDKAKYNLSKWQTDASSFWRSSGNRLLEPLDVAGWNVDKIMAFFKRWTTNEPYDYEKHIALADALIEKDKLSKTFSMLGVESWSEDVWTGINSMIGLNAEQSKNKAENHICPLPFDIVRRVIECWSMEGDLVLDPFGGLMTVPFCAIAMQRKAIGIELNPDYWKWGCQYLKSQEMKMDVPTLFDLEEVAA